MTQPQIQVLSQDRNGQPIYRKKNASEKVSLVSTSKQQSALAAANKAIANETGYNRTQTYSSINSGNPGNDTPGMLASAAQFTQVLGKSPSSHY